MGMMSPDRPGHSVERKAIRLGRELDFRTNMKEDKIAGNKVMSYSSCFIQNVYLAVEDIFSLFECVMC